ncbi:MAG: hypothetical protein KC415_12645 [Anaerolineales bacterium]|nr:hypothetical protein [Anaerolineales bacterium]MCB8990201.1 hypothetical protein [Ardenticatenaceae bacterium]MCB9003008.1 hypothetical protein [Ardenticatenaceae bacterium]
MYSDKEDSFGGWWLVGSGEQIIVNPKSSIVNLMGIIATAVPNSEFPV